MNTKKFKNLDIFTKESKDLKRVYKSYFNDSFTSLDFLKSMTPTTRLITNAHKTYKLFISNEMKRKFEEILDGAKIDSKIINEVNNLESIARTNLAYSYFKLSAPMESDLPIKQKFIRIKTADDYLHEFIELYDSINESNYLTNEEDLNILGEVINQEIDVKSTTISKNNNLELEAVLKSIHYIILAALLFYITNLDKFTDYKEAVLYYINNVEYVATTISRVNLRKKPDFSSEIKKPIPKDSMLKVYEEYDNGWVRVKINTNNIDTEGYVSKAYIKRVD